MTVSFIFTRVNAWYSKKNHNFVFFVFCNIVATHARTGHTGFMFAQSFSAAFAWSFSLVVTGYPFIDMLQHINEDARPT